MDFLMVRSLLSVDGGPLFLVRSPLPLYACRQCREHEWGYYFSSLWTGGRITAVGVGTSFLFSHNRCHRESEE